MKIGIQTLASKKYNIEIDGSSTVLALKQQIFAEHAICEVDEQKLIFLGKVLKNEQTIDSANIKAGAMIVMMQSKIKKSAPPAAAAAAEPTSSSSVAPPAAAAAAPASTDAPVAAPAAATPAPAAAAADVTPVAAPAAAVVAPTPAPAVDAAAVAPSVVAPATPSAAAVPTPAATAAASSALAMGSSLEPMIVNLMAIGFPRDQVQACLRASFNNPDRAADYLFNGIPESVSRDLNRGPAPSAGAGGAAGVASPSQGAPRASAPAVGNAQANSFAQAMAQAQAQQAGGGAGAGGVSPGNPLAGLAASPQFQQIRTMLQANPQMIPALLQQLSASDPQLAALIQANPEALMDLLSGGGGGGGGGGAAGGPAGGAGPSGGQTISVTQEEKQQIDNLEALGFDRHRALEAWLLCDRNEELAANYLFDNAGNDDADMGGH